VNGTVLVDTNVFTAPLRKGRPLEARYAKHTVGRVIVVAPQTVAEARYGALTGGWGERRLVELARLTSAVPVLPVDDETIEAVAQLRNECRLIGHALHQRHHNADLWIAAAAVRWNLPLVAHDGVFIGCPGLNLRTELAP
jgi:predicted nucleic acid-binding protein